MIKVKLKRFLVITMALSMVFSTNAFATPINLDDSSEGVVTDTLDKTNGTNYFADETTNNWQDGQVTERVDVTVKRASFFNITIPKEIVLNGNDGSASYEVSITGELAGDQALVVKPDDSFQLTEDGGKTTPVTVEQDKDAFNYQDIDNSVKGNGTLSASKISAGNWSGKFNFNIEFKDSSTPVIKTFNDYSWAEIAAISEAGNAASTFAVGDEKELTIGEYSYYDDCTKTTVTHPETTYHVQILGFNHDDKSDGSGKAGITVGLKEIMTTEHVMNSSESNAGGWRDCEMRTYVNNDVYNALPSDLQAVIKTVDKKTSEGNASTNITTTSDKLFLLSEVEISGSTSFSASGEGSQYQYFTDGDSINKYNRVGSSSCWWNRSPNIGNTHVSSSLVVTDGFCSVWNFDGNSGGPYFGHSNSSRGVVFSFSI